jgi:hypothetical protein
MEGSVFRVWEPVRVQGLEFSAWVIGFRVEG